MNGQTLRKQYKEVISGFREWREADHANEYLIFPENIGENLSLDETSLSNGEVYTLLTNKAGKEKKGTLVAIVQGVSADNINKILRKIPYELREKVKTITTDLSSAMMLIAKTAFPSATLINDRFHVQQLMNEAVDQLRIAYRWEYFNGCIGIILGDGTDIEKVKIKVSASQANYLRDLPLHESQQETEQTDEYSIFELHVRPTFDFQQELLWNGENLEVLEPLWLRKEIAEKVNRMWNKYKEDK